MFASKTKTLMKQLGAEGDLIYNENVKAKVPILSLVKVKQRTLWPVIRYTLVDQSLLELLEEAEFTPECTERVVVEDVTMHTFLTGRGEAELQAPEVGAKLKVSCAVDSVDGASTFTLKMKTVDVPKLKRRCNDRKLKQKMVDLLRVKKKEKLMFVYQIVFNVAPVTFIQDEEHEGCMMAGWPLSTKLQMQGRRKGKTSFTIPANSTFAYSLMEITTDRGTLGIPPRNTKVWQYRPGWWDLSTDSDVALDFVGAAVQELQGKAGLLQPLSDLPESTRQDLMKKLKQMQDDNKALTQWEDMLDQDASCLPDFDLSPRQRDAVLLLISAVNILPLGAAPSLIGSDPQALTVLRQLVSSLMDGHVTHPEAPPPSLQEEGELQWAVQLLCSTNKTLSQQWAEPDTPPERLLEVLSLTVIGLDMMMSSQPEQV